MTNKPIDLAVSNKYRQMIEDLTVVAGSLSREDFEAKLEEVRNFAREHGIPRDDL